MACPKNSAQRGLPSVFSPDFSMLPIAFLGFLMLSSGCQSQPPPSSQLMNPPPGQNKAPLVVRKSRAVAYKVLKSAQPLQRAVLTSMGGNLSIVVRPQDFHNAPVQCDADTCTATLIEPIVVNATIPTPLNVKLKVQYKKTRKPEEVIFSHKVFIGGQFTMIDMGDLLNVSAEIGFTLAATPENNFQPRITEILCSKSLSCETPLFAVTGTIDKSGIEFGGRLVVSERWTSSDKIVVDQIQQKTLITYDQIIQQEWLKNLPLPPCLNKKDYDTLWIPPSQRDPKK